MAKKNSGGAGQHNYRYRQGVLLIIILAQFAFSFQRTAIKVKDSLSVKETVTGRNDGGSGESNTFAMSKEAMDDYSNTYNVSSECLTLNQIRSSGVFFRNGKRGGADMPEYLIPITFYTVISIYIEVNLKKTRGS